MSFKAGRSLQISLFALGFTSLYTQIFLLREFMSVLYGNELVMAIILSNWMILTGIGAMFGSLFLRIRNKYPFLVFLQFVLALLPILTTLKLDLWKAFSVPFGSMVSLWTMYSVSLLLLAPFCLLNGFLFVAYSSLLSEMKNNNEYGRSYSMESFGSMAAGIVVNFVFLWLFDTWFSLKILLVVNMMVTFLLFRRSVPSFSKWIILPVMLLLMVLPFCTNLSGYCGRILFPGQKLLSSRETPYGKVDVTMNPGQLNFYENGLLLFSTGNAIFNEEAVHYAMVQHPAPKSVFLAGGGISGTMIEILKYPVERIGYVEINPAVIMTGLRFSDFSFDRRIHVYENDARKFLKTFPQKYDVALLNLPDPSTLQINRFFTSEFFHLLKSRLNPGAVVSLTLASTADYVSENAGRLNAVIFQTLRSVFENVIILPGQKNYFICSDRPVSTDIAAMIGRKGIQTQYVNAYYLDDDLLRDRSSYIVSHLPVTEEINKDSRPIAFFRQISYWTSFFGTNIKIIALVLIVFLILLGFVLNPVSFGLFTGGFTASSIEIIILLVSQVAFGFVYQMYGLIVTIFMTGLAGGSVLQHKFIPNPAIHSYLALQASLAGFCIILPVILYVSGLFAISGLPFILILSVLTFTIAFLTGLEFSVSTFLRPGSMANIPIRNYSADLFGSSLGVLVAAIFLIPLLGTCMSCALLAGLNILSASFLLIRRKKIVSL
jgi:spermidine synthase